MSGFDHEESRAAAPWFPQNGPSVTVTFPFRPLHLLGFCHRLQCLGNDEMAALFQLAVIGDRCGIKRSHLLRCKSVQAVPLRHKPGKHISCRRNSSVTEPEVRFGSGERPLGQPAPCSRWPDRAPSRSPRLMATAISSRQSPARPCASGTRFVQTGAARLSRPGVDGKHVQSSFPNCRRPMPSGQGRRRMHSGRHFVRISF